MLAFSLTAGCFLTQVIMSRVDVDAWFALLR